MTDQYLADLKLNLRQFDHIVLDRHGVDLRSSRGDLDLVTGKQNVAQAVINRLLTRQGELANLGHPNYGSRLFMLIGEPQNHRTKALAEFYIRECLTQDVRVKEVISLTVLEQPRDSDSRSLLEVELQLGLIGGEDFLQITIPVAL